MIYQPQVRDRMKIQWDIDRETKPGCKKKLYQDVSTINLADPPIGQSMVKYWSTFQSAKMMEKIYVFCGFLECHVKSAIFST